MKAVVEPYKAVTAPMVVVVARRNTRCIRSTRSASVVGVVGGTIDSCCRSRTRIWDCCFCLGMSRFLQ